MWWKVIFEINKKKNSIRIESNPIQSEPTNIFFSFFFHIQNMTHYYYWDSQMMINFNNERGPTVFVCMRVCSVSLSVSVHFLNESMNETNSQLRMSTNLHHHSQIRLFRCRCRSRQFVFFYYHAMIKRWWWWW